MGSKQEGMMTFQISQHRRDELLRIEEETNCDIGAGIEHGLHLGQYLTDRMNYIDRSRLIEFLQSELNELLPIAKIEVLADSIEAQIRQQIEKSA